jgi:hypothetical protein
VLDNDQSEADNPSMSESPEAIVKQFRKNAAKLDKEINTAAKARAFLIRAGIAEKDPSSPNGIRLVKQLR